MPPISTKSYDTPSVETFFKKVCQAVEEVVRESPHGDAEKWWNKLVTKEYQDKDIELFFTNLNQKSSKKQSYI